MSTNTLGLFLRHLALSQEVSRLGTASDHELLTAYELERGQAAFTELMRRHGPMVLRTCRRVLGRGPDAEDAFQATFVLLARKAGQLRREVTGPLSLGGWLHRVAYQTALDAFSQLTRRKAHERQAGAMTHSHHDPVIETTWNEIQPILDAELDALPDEARRLLIACYLQEKTHVEAAAELGLPPGSIAWRLEKARTLLAQRLARRGVTVSALLLAILLEDSAKGAGVPAMLLVHTVEAARRFTEQATGIVSDNVARLVKGGLAQMTKSSTHFGLLLAGWVGLMGAGLLACQTLKAWPDQTPQSEPPATSAAERPAQEVKKPARTDCFGDLLPPGALARMGTVRLFNGEVHFNPSGLLAFSPDGKVLASSVNRMTVALWDAATGKEMRRLTIDDTAESRGITVLVTALDFAPDGKTLVAVTCDQRVCLLDAATGKLLRTRGNQGPKIVYDGHRAFSRDGKMLAKADPHSGISVWDVANNKLLRQMKVAIHSFGAALAFSPDGKILVGGREGHLWEVSSGKEIRSLGLKQAKVALFSPDGKTLAVGDEVGVISLWEVATGKEIFPRPGHRESIRTVTYSPDGKTLASMGEDETVRLWDAATGKELRQLAKHNGWGSGVIVYSPDGKALASMEGRVLHLWDTATGKKIRQFEASGRFQSATFSPDGKFVAACMLVEGAVPGAVVTLWEMATGKEAYTRPTDYRGTDKQRPLAFSPDGRVLAAPGEDNTVSLWEVVTGKQLGGLKPPGPRGNEASVRYLAFSPDGRVLATSNSKDDKIRLWEVASGKQIGQLDGYKHLAGVEDAAWRKGCVLTFSPDGRMLATAVPERNGNLGADLAVTLWEVASGKEIGRLVGHRNVIQTIAFSPDGKTLASGGQDLTCLVWDVAAVAGRSKPVAADALPPKPLSKEQLEAAWADLASTDPAKAYRAVSVLREAPGQAVPLLKERVRPVAPVADPKQLARWIADLDDERFAVRQKAQRAIKGLGEPALPALRRALADQPSLEMKRRLQNILVAVEPKLVNVSPERLRQMRAVQVLESIATPEARQVLHSLAQGVAGVGLTCEAQAALERLARRSASRP